MLFVCYCATACCVKTMFIRHGPLSGSTASTIPAKESELEASRGSQVTPPTKKDKTEKSRADSDPKKTDHDNPKLPRSPTLHYSPEAPAQAPQPKKTAVKAKAAPTMKAKAAPASKAKASPTAKSGASKAPKVSPKAETPDENTAKAMQSTLQRANTVDLKTTVAAAPEPSSDDDMEGSSEASEDEEEENPEGTEGVTVEQLRERKRLHARYMRFSRSLKSSPSAYTTCICAQPCSLNFERFCIKYACMIDIFFWQYERTKRAHHYQILSELLFEFILQELLVTGTSKRHQKNEPKLVGTTKHFLEGSDALIFTSTHHWCCSRLRQKVSA